MANLGKIEGQGNKCRLVLHGFYDTYDADDGVEVLYKIKSPDPGQRLDLSAYADAQGYLKGTGADDDGNLSVDVPAQVNNVLCLSRVTRFLVSIKAGSINSEYECQAVNLNPIAITDEPEPQTQTEPESAPQSAPQSSFAQNEPQSGQWSEPETTPAPAVQRPKKSILPLLLGLLLLVLIAGAAAYFLLGSSGSGTVASSAPAATEETVAEESAQEEISEPEPAAEEELVTPEPATEEEQVIAVTPATEPGAPAQSLCPVSADAPDQELVQKCQALNDSSAMLALALEAADNGRCDLSKRILMSYGRQAGGEAFANAYAQFLNPGTPSHPCFDKSEEDAQYWRQKGGN